MLNTSAFKSPTHGKYELLNYRLTEMPIFKTLLGKYKLTNESTSKMKKNSCMSEEYIQRHSWENRKISTTSGINNLRPARGISWVLFADQFQSHSYSSSPLIKITDQIKTRTQKILIYGVQTSRTRNWHYVQSSSISAKKSWKVLFAEKNTEIFLRTITFLMFFTKFQSFCLALPF